MPAANPKRDEVRFTGFGGQGMAVLGYILGRAAAVYDGKNATMTQSYGPEARGGASSSQVIICSGPVYYPYVILPNILVGMSQEGYTKFRENLTDDALMLIDEDLVALEPDEDLSRVYKIPATRYAEELGRKIVANIVMLGFLSSLTDFVTDEAIRKAIADSVPRGTIDLNMKAYEKGRSHGQQLLKERSSKAKA
jgi:2-oxoglutarate ferredoxin oxidoreductase subunit gamma